MMEKERMTIMKIIRGIVMMWLALMPMLAAAVEYKSTYRGAVQPTFGIATTATAPSATFQSTSAYSSQWTAEQSTMLNSDGSVNSGAYLTSGPNRAKKDEILPPNPEIDPNDPGNVPLGEGLWLLVLLAAGYAARKRTSILES